jgi:redox-sensitive bicupin YhaK (pirin superfamily)
MLINYVAYITNSSSACCNLATRKRKGRSLPGAGAVWLASLRGQCEASGDADGGFGGQSWLWEEEETFSLEEEGEVGVVVLVIGGGIGWWRRLSHRQSRHETFC